MNILNSKQIDPEQAYSLVETARFTPASSREILTIHIRNGYLKAKTKGKGTGKRYWILGAWILEYLEKYNRKKNKYSRFMEFKDAPINEQFEKYDNSYRLRKKQ